MHEDEGVFCKTVIRWIIEKIASQGKKTMRAKSGWANGVQERLGGLLTLGLRPGSMQRLEEAGSWAARRAAGPSKMGRRGQARQDQARVNIGVARSSSCSK